MANTLNDQELQSVEGVVLEFLRTNQSITNRKLRAIAGVNYDQAIFFFNRMVDKGTLRRTGVASGTRYELPSFRPA